MATPTNTPRTTKATVTRGKKKRVAADRRAMPGHPNRTNRPEQREQSTITRLRQAQLAEAAAGVAAETSALERVMYGAGKKTGRVAGKTKQKLRAIDIGTPLASTYFWFYPVELLFAIMFIVSLWAHEHIWFVDMVVNTQELATLAWDMMIGIGFALLLLAFGAFEIGGVHILRNGVLLLTFMLCLAFSFAPYIFIVPWAIVWIVIVMFLAK